MDLADGALQLNDTLLAAVGADYAASGDLAGAGRALLTRLAQVGCTALGPVPDPLENRARHTSSRAPQTFGTPPHSASTAEPSAGCFRLLVVQDGVDFSLGNDSDYS